MLFFFRRPGTSPHWRSPCPRPDTAPSAPGPRPRAADPGIPALRCRCGGYPAPPGSCRGRWTAVRRDGPAGVYFHMASDITQFKIFHPCSLLYLVFCSFSERFCSMAVLSHTAGTINRIFNAFCRQKAARLQMRNRAADHLFISFNAQRHIPGCAAHGILFFSAISPMIGMMVYTA